MKKISILITIVAGLLLTGCGTKRSQAYYDQPSQLLSINYDGTYVIRTQVRARNAALANTDAQRKAVQEVIFDGIKAASNGGADVKPLCFDMNAREKYEEYFQIFFQDNGEWQKFVGLKDKRSGTSTYKKTESQMVRTITVTVDRAALKKKLQEDGIVPMQGRY